MMDAPDKQAPFSVPPLLRSEEFWLAAVIVSISLLVAGLIAGLVPTLFAAGQFGDRVDAYYKLALIGGAFVTFTTIMWRGVIASRQADQQREQLRAIETQIRQTDESNLASLLQQGAELIAANKSSSKIAAGIASLEAVAMSGNDRYVVPAMDILAFYIENRSSEGHTAPNTAAAIRSLRGAHIASGVSASRRIHCAGAHGNAQWLTVSGVSAITYSGGIFALGNFKPDRLPNICWFRDVKFSNCRMFEMSPGVFQNCTFNSCTFDSVQMTAILGNEYNNCDFSGTIFQQEIPSKIEGERNFYREDDPPRVAIEDAEGEFMGIEPVFDPPEWLIVRRPTYDPDLQ